MSTKYYDENGVEINVNSFPRPKIFDLIMKTGNINEKEMYNSIE